MQLDEERAKREHEKRLQLLEDEERLREEQLKLAADKRRVELKEAYMKEQERHAAYQARIARKTGIQPLFPHAHDTTFTRTLSGQACASRPPIEKLIPDPPSLPPTLLHFRQAF